MAAADQLPDQLGDAVIGTARQAFMHGLHLVVAISAAVGIGVAIAAAFLLRRHAKPRPPQLDPMPPDRKERDR
jgi:MFS transporter, DHA2 family, multidrug resistance protein